MARKVIIDCDPGIDDAVALTLALFDPRLEVIGITATAGNVPADIATRNVQTVIEQLDPNRRPRVGKAMPPTTGGGVDGLQLYGADGLGNCNFAVSELQHQHLSEKVIVDLVRANPGSVTIIALGPLTNVARAFRLDSDLPGLVDRLIIAGGSVEAIGNITPVAEFNMYYNPVAAREVFSSRTTKTIVPLDVTSRVSFSLDLLSQLPPDSTRAGVFLRRMLPFLFRSYRQFHGQESIHLGDTIGLLAATDAALFETEELAADVEVSGELTTGMTIFDRRPGRGVHSDIEVALQVDTQGVVDQVVRGLTEAGNQTKM